MSTLALNGLTAKVRNAGQVCVAPQRFYVHSKVAGEFTDSAVEAARAQIVGDGRDPTTTIGPLINSDQRDRVERIVAQTVDQGGTVRTGGSRLDRRGYFYQPTVVTDVKPGSPLHEDEVFGPVLPIIQFGSVHDVVEMANSSEYGLAAYVHTRDIATAMAVSEQLDYGMVAVNDWYVATPEAPFGGMKQSGLGRESGAEGIHEYLEAKTRYFGGIV
jgi:acyl-CoA reductase-like NAD-dependent aldehyde dehydrogenase